MGYAPYLFRKEICDINPCLLLHKMLDQVHTHLPHPLNRDTPSFKAVISEDLLNGGLHPHVHAKRGHWRRITPSTHGLGQAGNMWRLHTDIFHIRGFHVHIFSRYVFTIETIDKLSEPAQKCFRLQRFRVTDDYSFSSSEVNAADRSFERHSTGKAENIRQRFLLRRVIPHPGTSECRTKHCIMYRDDRPQVCDL